MSGPGAAAGPTRPVVTRWFTSFCRSETPRLRLYCFPYAGGSEIAYRSWPEGLPPGVEVRAVHTPGRGALIREPLVRDLRILVRTISHGLLPLPGGPTAFFGHSMGALVAFEVARELRRLCGVVPAHLFISACRAPQVPDPKPPIHALADDAFVTALLRFNGMPQEVANDRALMEVFLPVLRADITAYETYSYAAGPLLPCPISVFGGTEDQDVTGEQLMAWATHTPSRFELRMIEGDHFFALTSRTFRDVFSMDVAALLRQFD